MRFGNQVAMLGNTPIKTPITTKAAINGRHPLNTVWSETPSQKPETR